MEKSLTASTTTSNPIRKPQRALCYGRLFCEMFLIVLIFTVFVSFLLLWPKGEHFIKQKVLAKVTLAPMSDGNDSWMFPPATTIRAYRLFDVTNYMDVMTDPNKPLKIRETDPFHYKLSVKKNNVEWLENNTRIHYSVERLFTRHGEFDEKLINQEGAFIDILRVMIRSKAPRIVEKNFYMLGGNNAFNYSRAIDKLEGFVSTVFAAVSLQMQGPNKDKYGFIYRYNGTNGFNYTIQNGIKDTSMKGLMIDFASEYTPFKTNMNEWKTPIFDGMTFPTLGNPPNRKYINVFQPDFCRPVQLRYNRTISKDGFENLHEYVLKLVDYKKCPAMDETCPEADKLDISQCVSSAIPAETLFLSKPHLYGHDSTWTNVDFKPNADQHESTVYFEPLSGTPVSARLRIQMSTNAWIDRIKLFPDGSTEPTHSFGVRRFIPIMWIDQTITLNTDKVESLAKAQMFLQKASNVHDRLRLFYIIVGFFCVMGTVLTIELFAYARRRKIDKSVLYEPSQDQEKELLSPTKATAPIA